MPLPSTPFPPRSDYDAVCGVIFFARLLDKIRLHAEGRLPADYNLGFNKPDTFDARFCRFWQIDFDALTVETLKGGSDEEVFAAIFARRLPLIEEHVRAWNGFISKRGWRDDASADLVEDRTALGFGDRDDIQTYVDLHQIDEGREIRHAGIG